MSLALSQEAFTQGFSWAGQLSGPSVNSGTNMKGSAIDANGNIYITGGFEAIVDFDPGPGIHNLTAVNTNAGGDDVFIAKYSPGGALIWAKNVGSVKMDFGRSITVHPNGTLEIVGDFRGPTDFDPGPGVTMLTPATINHDIFILKLDPGGNFISARSINAAINATLYAHGVKSDKEGNSVIWFNSSNTIDFDPGPSVLNITSNIEDIVIGKYAPNGSVIWVKNFAGGFGIDDVTEILFDNNNNMTVSGSFSNAVDFDPGPGVHTLTSDGSRDGFIARYDAAGNFHWVRQLRNTDMLGISQFVMDATGDIYCVGYFTGDGDFDPGPGTFILNTPVSGIGNYDAFILKLENTGDFAWAARFVITGETEGTSILIDHEGVLRLTVNFNGSIDADPGSSVSSINTSGLTDIAFIRIKTDGSLISSARIGGTAYQYVQQAKMDNDGAIFYGGSFGGTVDFDPGPGTFFLTSGSSTSSTEYLMKFSGVNYIKGSVFQDNNGNGSQQPGELFMKNIMIKATRNGLDYHGISDSTGQYSIEVDPGNYVITPALPLYFSSIIPATQNADFGTQTGQTDTANHFGLVPSSIISDARITITQAGPARPGFFVMYWLTCENVGTEKISGNIVLTPDPQLSFYSAIPPANPPNNWSFTNLLPNEIRDIDVVFWIPPTAVLGTFLQFYVNLTTTTQDFNLFDNIDSLRQMITGSFDPNDKKVIPDGGISTGYIGNGGYLDYTIRFQNTGTDTAFIVRIQDTLSNNLDIQTLKMIGASHPYSIKINPGHIVEWNFDNILLPDSNINELRSHGFVRFKVKPKNTLVPGNQVRNKASIYFDYNAPVITNETQNVVTVVTSVPSTGSTPVVKIYPNPATALLRIETTGYFDYVITDESGKVIRKETGKYNAVNINIVSLPRGIYFIRIETNKGHVVRKIAVH